MNMSLNATVDIDVVIAKSRGAADSTRQSRSAIGLVTRIVSRC
jgi:hypothetical protein